jgi:hypothetical protein
MEDSMKGRGMLSRPWLNKDFQFRNRRTASLDLRLVEGRHTPKIAPGRKTIHPLRRELVRDLARNTVSLK